MLLSLRLPLKDTDTVCEPLTAPDAVVDTTRVVPVPLGEKLGVPVALSVIDIPPPAVVEEA